VQAEFGTDDATGAAGAARVGPDDADIARQVVKAQLAAPGNDPHQVVVSNPTGDVTMLGLLRMTARLVAQQGDDVSPAAHEAARRVLATG
jgi:hypothetical protein